MAENPSLDINTLDLMCKAINEVLDSKQMQYDIMMIGSSQIYDLVNTETAQKLQSISDKLNDIKGELTGINIEGNALRKQGGSYPRKTLRKSHKKSRRTRKH
jgi:hypothetical protein